MLFNTCDSHSEQALIHDFLEWLPEIAIRKLRIVRDIKFQGLEDDDPGDSDLDDDSLDDGALGDGSLAHDGLDDDGLGLAGQDDGGVDDDGQGDDGPNDDSPMSPISPYLHLPRITQMVELGGANVVRQIARY